MTGEAHLISGRRCGVSRLGVALDEAGRLAEERTCLRCGYNLRGLEPGGVCPECALPVRHSLNSDSLRFADRSWLRTVRRGLWLVTASFGGIVVTSYFTVFGALFGVLIDFDTRPGSFVAAALSVVGIATLAVCGVGAIVGLIGLLLVTACEPAERGGRAGVWARRWTRRLTWAFAPVGACTALLAQGKVMPSAICYECLPVAIALSIAVGLALAFAACLLMGSFIRRTEVPAGDLPWVAAVAVVAVGVLLAICVMANLVDGAFPGIQPVLIGDAILLVGVVPLTPVVILLLLVRTYRAVSRGWRDNLAGPWRMLRVR
jgi:hypothetical protein